MHGPGEVLQLAVTQTSGWWFVIGKRGKVGCWRVEISEVTRFTGLGLGKS
jgi:hypothetical protein